MCLRTEVVINWLWPFHPQGLFTVGHSIKAVLDFWTSHHNGKVLSEKSLKAYRLRRDTTLCVSPALKCRPSTNITHTHRPYTHRAQLWQTAPLRQKLLHRYFALSEASFRGRSLWRPLCVTLRVRDQLSWLSTYYHLGPELTNRSCKGKCSGFMTCTLNWAAS